MLASDVQVLSVEKNGCHASQNGPANLAQTRRHFSTNPLRPVLDPPHTCFSPRAFPFPLSLHYGLCKIRGFSPPPPQSNKGWPPEEIINLMWKGGDEREKQISFPATRGDYSRKSRGVFRGPSKGWFHCCFLTNLCFTPFTGGVRTEPPFPDVMCFIC